MRKQLFYVPKITHPSPKTDRPETAYDVEFHKNHYGNGIRQVQQPKRVNSITLEQISFEYVHIKQT